MAGVRPTDRLEEINMKLILCGDIVPTEYTTATFEKKDCA